MSAYVLDIETTGTTEPIQPINIAYGRLTMFDTSRRTRHLTRLAQPPNHAPVWFRPTRLIECGAMENCKEWVPGSFQLPNDCDYLVGHNVDYDWKVIGCPNVKRICTLALARAQWPKADSHSLSALQFLAHDTHERAREVTREAHDALADCSMAAFLLTVLNRTIQARSWEALHEYSEHVRIPQFMPFGKHKGEPINKVPADYKRWLLGQSDVDPYLAKALRFG